MIIQPFVALMKPFENLKACKDRKAYYPQSYHRSSLYSYQSNCATPVGSPQVRHFPLRSLIRVPLTRRSPTRRHRLILAEFSSVGA
jgi:hypothetical protein